MESHGKGSDGKGGGNAKPERVTQAQKKEALIGFLSGTVVAVLTNLLTKGYVFGLDLRQQ